ncbi:MAG TPA: helix-turn-helix domain-containing protein, partial [Pseudonocardiaceae bacterium]
MSEETRRITDSKVLAAMAHPLRRRLLDVLKVYGPATVSALAEHTGQAVGNISHHMKVLSAAALVEQASELAHDRRERWWRLRTGSLSWSWQDFDNDPAAS